MTTPPPGSREAVQALEWLIKKRGYFYRADKAGYTAKVDEAGLYTEADAKAEARIEPEVMSAHHISEFPTLRAALAPPADGAGEVEAIRARHEYAEQKGGDLYTPEYCEWSFSQCHADRATLLSLLSEERARRVEVEAKLASRLEPDMYWDLDDAERPYDSVEEILWESNAEGEGIIEVQSAISCPHAAFIYRFNNDPETDDRDVSLERLSDDDYKHYRAAMSIASGAQAMWDQMVDNLAAKLFEENPSPLHAWMHGKPWRSIDWHYRKHHRRLAHDQLVATHKDTQDE